MEKKPLILIVDDEVGVLNALERLLKLDGYEIRRAQEPFEALEILKQEPIDLIISDHLMPGMKGLDLLKEAKNIRPDAIRIILTGHADLALAMKAINEGEVYRFFTKPWDDDELRLDVKLAIEKLMLERENKKLKKELSEKEKALKELEAKFPGITQVKRDARGAIIIEDEDLEGE
jgi:DNA-binding NtrC family response regulator